MSIATWSRESRRRRSRSIVIGAEALADESAELATPGAETGAPGAGRPPAAHASQERAGHDAHPPKDGKGHARGASPIETGATERPSQRAAKRRRARRALALGALAGAAGLALLGGLGEREQGTGAPPSLEASRPAERPTRGLLSPRAAGDRGPKDAREASRPMKGGATRSRSGPVPVPAAPPAPVSPPAPAPSSPPAPTSPPPAAAQPQPAPASAADVQREFGP